MVYNPSWQNWSPVTDLLNQSLHAEEMVCSMSSQLFHIPATANLRGNREMHEHLYEASYHRVTALGSAKRLQNGEYHDSLVQTLVECVQNALSADREVNRWLEVMRNNAPNEYRVFVESIVNWQQEAVRTLLQAQNLLNQMGYEASQQAQNNETAY